jgi:hypothetical protein
LSQAQESQKAAQGLASIATQLSQLMRQFKIERRDARVEVSLPVRLTALDPEGPVGDQEVWTINVSQHGALLKGIRGQLSMGGRVSLSRLNKREDFLIAWVGKRNTPEADQIGISAVNPASTFWNDAIEAHAGAGEASTKNNLSDKVPAKPKARAQGA